jgi:hypothetical protein
MLRSFDGSGAGERVRVRLRIAGSLQPRLKMLASGLAVLNAVALAFLLFPPGGTREELSEQIQQLRGQIASARAQTTRLKTTAANVQSGSAQSSSFEAKYFLPKRLAYVAVVGEIQRMAKASGLEERDGVYTEEPIEGTVDLSVLNITSNYEGSYVSLMRFLNEVDRSPMLLMLDALQAAPQQKSGQVNASVRFQAIVREPAPSLLGQGGQP